MTSSRLQSRRSAHAGRLGALTVLLALGGVACSDTQKREVEATARQQARALADEPATVRTSAGLEAVQGELLVRFKGGAYLAAAQQAHSALGATVVHTYRSLEGLQLVHLPKDMDVEAAAGLYLKQPGVLYAEPNYLYRTAALPDDPRLGDLWGLNNTGQSNGTADADINAPEAWDLTTGSDDTVIAVIDSGINYLHEDLAGNMWVNPGEVPDNDVDDDNNGYVDDIHGINAIANSGDPLDDNRHGSHCAGTIAGRGNNALGVAGVNWRARLIGCKFLSSAGSGSTANALKCMDYLYNLRTRDSNPVDLVATSNSWGGGAFSQALQDAIERHQQAGILFVAAAGNSNANNDTTASYPSGYPLPNIIAVAATDRNDAKASFSSYGRRRVHIAAPGVDILSTTLGTNSYELLSGTSMATPHVTGLVGLLKAQEPSRDWRALKNLVLAGGQDVASMNGITITGRRIRAADTGGRGSLTCDNQPFTTRLSPIADSLQLLRGAKVELSALNINCASPAGDVVLTVAPTGSTLTLTDTGTGLDRAAGDGIYTTEWEPPGAGSYTLTFPSGETVTLTVLDVYRPAVAQASQWRSITGTPLDLADNTSLQVTPPFPIRYGNHPGLTTAWVSSEGYLSFTDSRLTSVNARLPTTNFQTLVAPFWDSLHTASATPGNVYQEVLGTAPNREWVVEWRNTGHSARSSVTPYESITFQAVFFESSPEVLFNYQDVDFGSGTGTYDRGASATVGVQVNSTAATLFSYNTRSLTPDMSLLWRINAPPVVGDPSASPTSVPEGGTIELSASFTDADGAVDADWTAEADFNYTGTTFDVEASQVLSTEGTATFTRTFPQSGRSTVGLRVKDKDGAYSVVRTVLVDITNVAPVAGALSTDPAQGTEGSPLRLVSSFSDVGVSDSPWKVQFDLDYDGTTFNVDRERSYTLAGPVELTHTFPEDGPRTVAVRIVDLDNSASNVQTLQLDIQDVSPVIQASSVTPATGSEPRTVELSVSAASGSADATLDPVSYYHWDFDGDGNVDLLTTSPRAVYRYVDNPQGGDTWPAQVWVEDEDSRTRVDLPVVVNNTPPVLAAVLPDHTAQEGTAFRLQLTATDSAGMYDPLTWELRGAPEGMSVSPSGLLQWVPAFQQTSAAGTAYTVQVTVSDDDGASASASFTVAATWKDEDGDAMPDTWERANGLDPTRNDAGEDADGDGVSNLDETLDGTGGPRLPGQVRARLPQQGEHVRSAGLTLVVENTTDPDSPVLTYEFAVYSDAALTQQVATATAQAGDSGQTSATVADTQLRDGSDYWWRARASDGQRHGPWSTPRHVYYNPLNGQPTAPVAVSPSSGVSTPEPQPVLVVLNARDEEGDTLTYEFEVHAGGTEGQVVASAASVPEGPSGTRLVLTQALADGIYVWRARAVDSRGAQGPWSAPATFRVALPASPEPPSSGCSASGPGSALGLLPLLLAGLSLRRRRNG